MRRKWTESVEIDLKIIDSACQHLVQRKCPYCGRYAAEISSFIQNEYSHYEYCPFCGEKVKINDFE